MKLTLRPLMAPLSVTIREGAACTVRVVPYAEAGPEYGMMLPTLISVSLAPGSYFFCAVAGAAITHSATDAISARMAFRMASSVARPRSAAVSGQASGNQTPKPRRPHRHHEDDQQQNHPVDRAGEALRG